MAPIWPTTAANPFDCNTSYRLITQRSEVQILPPQPFPAKLSHSQTPLSFSDSDLAHLWPTGFFVFAALFSLLKFSTSFCAYLDPGHRLPHCRPINIRVFVHRKFFLSSCGLFVTVLVRRTVTLFVFLCQSLSLRKLCVALLCAKGASNENQTGFIECLRSFHPARVYAGCHAQPCAGSRTARTPWFTTAMSSGVQCREKASQASPQVIGLQGVSVRGRLAY